MKFFFMLYATDLNITQYSVLMYLVLSNIKHIERFGLLPCTIQKLFFNVKHEQYIYQPKAHSQRASPDSGSLTTQFTATSLSVHAFWSSSVNI